MKILIILLLILASFNSKAQFPFFDDFESAPAFSVPPNYTGDITIYLVHGIGGGKALTSPRFTFLNNDSITTPFIGPLSSDAVLSFQWRAATAIASVYPVSGEPLNANDFVKVSVSTNGTDFTTKYTINNSNSTASTDFATVFVPLSEYSGQNVKVKFSIRTVGHASDFFIDIDNLTLGGTVVACENDADEDGVCDEDEIVGCQETDACNFDPFATDAGSCEYPAEYYDCDGQCINDLDDDGICNELEIQGCQEEEACNYNPEATDNVGCVYVISLTISGESSPFGGDNYVYTYPNTAGSTYLWQVTNGIIESGQGTSTVSVLWDAQSETGEISVTETNSIDCVGNTVSLPCDLIITSLSEFYKNEIKIWPNPATDFLNFSGSDVHAGDQITITNQLGKVVISTTLNGLNTLDISSLASGTYFLDISNRAKAHFMIVSK